MSHNHPKTPKDTDTLNAMREVTEDNLPSYDSLDEMMVDVYAKI